jgi:predicted PurR-regulated permease PerM
VKQWYHLEIELMRQSHVAAPLVMESRRKGKEDDGVKANWPFQPIARAILIVAVTLASIWMLWRYLPALAWAGVLATATWPLRDRIAKAGFGKDTVASVLTVLVAVVLVLPLIKLGLEAASELRGLAPWLSEIDRHGLAAPEWLHRLPYFGSTLVEWWQAHLAQPGGVRELFGRADPGGVVAVTRTIGFELANRLVLLIFTLLALFFLYRDGPLLIKEARGNAERLLGPFGTHLGENVVMAVRGTVNGLVLVGLGEGLLLGIGYVVAGLSHAVLLGLATAVLAPVPFGASVIFGGCALFLLAHSHTVAAIALLAFGSLVVFIADHFVRPLLIGGAARVPFLWVLLGILGGLESFGLIGLFLGPALISVFMAIWREGSEKAEGHRAIGAV